MIETTIVKVTTRTLSRGDIDAILLGHFGLEVDGAKVVYAYEQGFLRDVTITTTEPVNP